MARVHSYRSELTWQGTTADGYASYSRAHHVRTPPAEATLDVTADVPFRGDPALTNPEQLLLAAASSCQLLSFLAEAASARVDVVAYTDHAEAFMPVTREPLWVQRIVLRPHVVVRGQVDDAEVVRLLEAGHDGCFIASSLRSEIVLEPTVEHVD
ncbi:MAG TPA: OsmC family protein [Actinomycetales bacterium]|nr:OsmC family protein [Actinomycetales bacterium]